MSIEERKTEDLEKQLEELKWFCYVAIEEQDPGLDYERTINFIEAELERRKQCLKLF